MIPMRAQANNVSGDSFGVPFKSIPVYNGRNVPAHAWSTYPENIYAQYENEDDYYQDTNEALDEKRNAMQAKKVKGYENEFFIQQKKAEAQEAAQERFRMGYTKSEPMDEAWDMLEKKLCPEGKAAAKRKFKVYPSAYANGWAVQYCSGKFKKKGKKK